SSNDSIGGPSAADRNVISGNKGDGVHILFGGSANNILFQNNYIGTDASGTERLANGGDGVNIFATSAFDRILDNTTAGHAFNGISFSGNGPSDCLIQGNLTGTDKAGIGPIGNGSSGVDVGGPPRTRIVGNVISGNNGSGVNLTFDSTVGTVMQGN